MRLSEAQKSVVLTLSFGDERDGCKKKELAHSAVELLTGFLPGQRITPDTAADDDDGSEAVHSKVGCERR